DRGGNVICLVDRWLMNGWQALGPSSTREASGHLPGLQRERVVDGSRRGRGRQRRHAHHGGAKVSHAGSRRLLGR
ncbi:unnamed protein product, partial [Laminaria digitata]